MKRKPLKPVVTALILVLIYLFGLVAGIFVISYMPSGEKRVGLSYFVKSLAKDYNETRSINNWSMAGVAAAVYDADGQLLDLFRGNTRPMNIDIDAASRRDLQKVLDGQTATRLYPLVGDYSTLGYTSLFFVGIPLVRGGTAQGALFWVRELQDLLEIIIGYICVFTAFFATAAVFLLLNLRNQQRLERVRRQYIDNITHELKSPIASIKALTEALSDGMEKSPNDRSVYYGMIIREANRQERMIHDALELSKLQSASEKPLRQPVDAAEIFQPVCEKYASLCDLMGLRFTVADEIRDLPKLCTDAESIRQVLETLLGNAMKFVSEGGEIRLSAQPGHWKITVCVADNGIGIPAEDLPHVFDRFYKVKRSDNESGSGLGLAIAKERMAGLNEKIWITSGDGKGTSVFFTISVQ